MPLRITWSWYTCRWWVGCYIWYSEEGTGRGHSPPRPLLAVPNVIAHPSTASVPITVLLYSGPLLCGFNVPVIGLIKYFYVPLCVQRCRVHWRAVSMLLICRTWRFDFYRSCTHYYLALSESDVLIVAAYVCLLVCQQDYRKLKLFIIKKMYERRYESRHLLKTNLREKYKKNTFCGMAVSVPLPKFSEKLLHHTKFHWNRAIRCWVMAKRRFSIWQPSAILNLKKNHSWSRDCYRVPNMHLGTKFCPNQMIFCWVMAILWYTIWRSSFILNFRNLEFMSRDFYCDAILLWCAKFHLNRTIGCWVMAKNDF